MKSTKPKNNSEVKVLARYFNFDELNTGFRQEILAGFTTFVTMAYIIIVNPKILEAAGLPFGPSMVATIISAFFGTLIMGVYAKRPFAIAPYMGENAFIAFTVVKVLGYSWQTAIGAIFIGGVLFTLLTILNIRSWIANSIPETLKIAFAVGIGLFITFIGLTTTGIIVAAEPVSVGKLNEASNLLAIFGFLLIGFLMIKKVNAAILAGIFITALLGFILGVSPIPEKIVSMPPDISPILFELDIFGALSWGFFAVILTVFIIDFVDTMGTLMGMSYKAGLLDEEGNLPDIEKPLLCDALATVVASLLGTTTTGVYLESAAGIEAGGKSGMTAVVTALLFLVALFFSPLLTAIPGYAYGPALIIVGLLMMSPIVKINFDNLSESIPVFVTMIMMSFSFNLGVGLTSGLVIYPVTQIFAGKVKEVSNGMWVLFGLSLLFYIFYPY